MVEGGLQVRHLPDQRRAEQYADVGWRVGPSASITEGAAEFQVHEDNVDLSFVSGIRAIVAGEMVLFRFPVAPASSAEFHFLGLGSATWCRALCRPR